jgi:RHS repeat-associated protein
MRSRPTSFTGKERDAESGLDNFGARYDASSVGRFMTPDPLMASAKVWDPQTWNRYAYALNNPLKYVDPTGMNEVTADQCAKDKNCVTVKVNVIYDKNANDGKGLTDKQKADFEKGQLQNAKDQYGNADIHLDVTYTAGAVSNDSGKTTVSGLQAGALNVVVTDQVNAGRSGMAGKTAVSFVNPEATDLPHEMAHQFMGDTQGWKNYVMTNDPTMIGAILLNTYTDVGNDFNALGCEISIVILAPSATIH